MHHLHKRDDFADGQGHLSPSVAGRTVSPVAGWLAVASLATKLRMVPAKRCGLSRVLLLGVLWGGAARLTVFGAAAVTSALFRGEGSGSFGEASYLCLEVFVVGEVVLRRSRDCGD